MGKCGRGKVEGQRLGRLPFGGETDNEYVLRGMMWVDNYWLFCDNKERLVCIVKDIVEELVDLEPIPESLWWTSTYKDEDTATLRVGSRGKTWIVIGRGFKAQNGQCAKVWAAGGGTGISIVQRVYLCWQNAGESSVTSTVRL